MVDSSFFTDGPVNEGAAVAPPAPAAFYADPTASAASAGQAADSATAAAASATAAAAAAASAVAASIGKADVNSPTFTGVPAAPTPSNGDNSTRLATTAWVQANAVGSSPATATPAMDGTAAVGVSAKYAREDHVHPTDTSRASVAYVNSQIATVASVSYVDTQDATKAPLASPALTGVPTAPTAASGTSTLQIATTAFVTTALTPLRLVLTSAFNLYVSTTGSDSNNGFSTGTALLTIQKAIDTLASRYDLGGQAVTINVGAGSFAGFNFKAMVGLASPASLLVTGAGATTIITSTLSCLGYGVTGTIANLQVAAGASNVGISVNGRAHLVMNAGITFGSNVYHAAISQSSSLNIQGNFAIAASATFAFYVSTNSMLMAEGFGTCTITGSPAWASGFVYAENGSAVRIPSNTFTGASTGPRYQANGNATIFVNAAGATYLPGSTPGTTSNGGLYI
jgi:hypothetical protein